MSIFSHKYLLNLSISFYLQLQSANPFYQTPISLAWLTAETSQLAFLFPLLLSYSQCPTVAYARAAFFRLPRANCVHHFSNPTFSDILAP